MNFKLFAAFVAVAFVAFASNVEASSSPLDIFGKKEIVLEICSGSIFTIMFFVYLAKVLI